jgi:riboflavin biosynthesis pyrimidine reductase
MIVSVDGAASLQGRSGALGGPADKALFATLRSLADVLLVGAGTMRAEGYGPARLSDDARARRRDWGLPPVPPIAVITRSCRLDSSAAGLLDEICLTVAPVLAADGYLFLCYRRR